MTGFAALDETESTMREETPQGLAGRRAGEAGAARQPCNGKADAGAAFQPAMAEEMRIDGAVDDRQAESRDNEILELFPGLCGI